MKENKVQCIAYPTKFTGLFSHTILHFLYITYSKLQHQVESDFQKLIPVSTFWLVVSLSLAHSRGLFISMNFCLQN